MRLERFNIPDVIELPGVTIEVQVTERKYMTGDADGYWSYTNCGGLIRIAADLPIRRQRYILLHELLHAINDVMHVGLQEHHPVLKP
jgi:Zn-dependent peptidase ImmA (M78 family)